QAQLIGHRLLPVRDVELRHPLDDVAGPRQTLLAYAVGLDVEWRVVEALTVDLDHQPGPPEGVDPTDGTVGVPEHDLELRRRQPGGLGDLEEVSLEAALGVTGAQLQLLDQAAERLGTGPTA